MPGTGVMKWIRNGALLYRVSVFSSEKMQTQSVTVQCSRCCKKVSFGGLWEEQFAMLEESESSSQFV